MNNCAPDFTLSAIQQALINNVNPGNYIRDNFPNLSHDEIADILVKLRGLVETKLVSAKDLKLNAALVDSAGKANRYVWKGTNQVAFRDRATDAAKIETAKTFRNDREKSQSPDSIIQAENGTNAHALFQAIMEHLIHHDKTGLINKSKYEYKIGSENDYDFKNLNGLKDYARELNLAVHFDVLYKGAEAIFEQIKEKQSLINAKKGAQEKAYIFTEQFVFSKNMGATMDLFYLLSDKKSGVFDYKLISTPTDELERDWIPYYKQKSMNIQISKIHDVLTKEWGFEVEQMRVVPVQVQYQLKPKKDQEEGKKLTKNIKVLRMGKEYSKFLTQIPFITEKFDSKELTEAVNKLLIVKNNIIVDLNETPKEAGAKRERLENELAQIQNQINKIQVDRDIAATFDYFKELVDSYSIFEKGSYRLKNVDSYEIETINEFGDKVKIKNPSYLSLENMRNLHDSIYVLMQIISSSEEFMRELNIKDQEKYDFYRKLQGEYAIRGTVVLNDLSERMLHRVLTEEQINELKDSYSLGFISRQFFRVSEQQNVLIQEMYRLLSMANDNKRLALQAFESELESVLLPLQQWGKRNGKTGFSMFDIMIDKSTGNLYGTYTSDFFKMLNDQKDIVKNSRKDSERKQAKNNILKYYTLREDADKIYKTIEDNFKRTYNPSEKELEAFKKRWQFDSNYVVGKKLNVLYKLDISKVEDSYLTKQYLEFRKPQNKEVLDFYQFWEKSMYKFLNMLEVYGDGYYSNFIPWVKLETTEALIKEGPGLAFQEMKETTKLALGMEHRTEDLLTGDKFIQGKIRPETGEELRSVPRFFLNPIYNNDGVVDTTMKSFNLGNVLQQFAEMAYNYNYKSKIEPILETLKDISLTDVAGVLTETGEKIPGGDVIRLKGAKSEIFNYLDKMINYSVYGLQYDMDTNEISRKLSRIALSIDRYNKSRLFAFNITSAEKAQTASRLAIAFESIKGIYFTREMKTKSDRLQLEALKDATVGKANDNVFIQVSKFFSIHSDPLTPDRIAKFSVNPFDSLGGISTEDIVNMLGRGDRAIDNNVLVAMMQNYGIHEGKIIRLNKESNKGLKVKTLLEASSIKKGKLFIEGIHDSEGKVNKELYNEFRNIAMSVAISIKGSLSPEDMNMVSTTLFGKLFMSLKTFIPALAKERFEGISYNRMTREITVGRYASIAQNVFSRMGEKERDFLDSIKDNPEKINEVGGLIGYTAVNFFKQAGNLLFMMSTYGLANIVTLGRAANMDLADFSKNLVIADERSRAIFENFKAKYPNTKEIQELKYEDFLQYKLQQAKAMAVELAGIVAIALMLGVLRRMDLDDDEKKDYRNNKAIRYVYRQLLGTYREVSFFVNPMDWTRNVESITPIISLIKTLGKLVGNTGDEFRDFVFGENSAQDKTPMFYYLSKMVPYANALARMLELFPEDEKVYD